MSNAILFKNLFPDFHSSEIGSGELEKIIIDAVEADNPDDSVEDIEYTDDGIEVLMDSGNVIEIEIDWNEIILI